MPVPIRPYSPPLSDSPRQNQNLQIVISNVPATQPSLCGTSGMRPFSWAMIFGLSDAVALSRASPVLRIVSLRRVPEQTHFANSVGERLDAGDASLISCALSRGRARRVSVTGRRAAIVQRSAHSGGIGHGEGLQQHLQAVGEPDAREPAAQGHGVPRARRPSCLSAGRPRVHEDSCRLPVPHSPRRGMRAGRVDAYRTLRPLPDAPERRRPRPVPPRPRSFVVLPRRRARGLRRQRRASGRSGVPAADAGSRERDTSAGRSPPFVGTPAPQHPPATSMRLGKRLQMSDILSYAISNQL